MLPTYGFAHAKIKKSIFNYKFLELVPDIGIILNDFSEWFYLDWVKSTRLKKLKISGTQPSDPNSRPFDVLNNMTSNSYMFNSSCILQI